jgi:hypothetical protein
MTYFKISTGKFIEYNELTNQAHILVKADLQALKDDLQARIGTVDPNQPSTNAEWIAYGKAHYPYTDHSVEQQELDKVNGQLEAIKNL